MVAHLNDDPTIAELAQGMRTVVGLFRTRFSPDHRRHAPPVAGSKEGRTGADLPAGKRTGAGGYRRHVRLCRPKPFHQGLCQV